MRIQVCMKNVLRVQKAANAGMYLPMVHGLCVTKPPTPTPLTTLPTLTTTMVTTQAHRQSGRDIMEIQERLKIVLRVPKAANAGMYLPMVIGLCVDDQG